MCDLHIHTHLSPCGARDESLSSVGAYAAEAGRRGLETICITDHFALPAPWVPSWYDGCGPEIIQRVRADAAAIDNGVAVLVGCEAEMVAPDKVTIDAGFARALDFVIIAASHFNFAEIGPTSPCEPGEVAGALMEFLGAAVRLPFADTVAHPLVVPGRASGDPADYIPLIGDAEFAAVCGTAARNGVAFEINGSMAGQPDYRALMRRLFLIAASEGVRFTVGSDAHAAPQMDRLDYIEAYSRELGLSRDNFLNADRLPAWRRERGRDFR
jgi:histidinol phosphatase-like PHP family hydrolase